MSEAERLLNESLLAKQFGSHTLGRLWALGLMESYGRLVQEAAAKEASRVMRANIMNGLLKDMNGSVSQYDAESAIREMPLP
jgi:hypothetical protein